MKIYLAGGMTGIPFFNFPAFDLHKYTLTKQGHEVFSPADHDRMLLRKPIDWMPTEEDATQGWRAWRVPNPPSLRQMLGDDLHYICTEADGIAMIPGWEKSMGARAEHAVASCLGLHMRYL